MSRWFRHYAGMMRDDKLVRVALKSGQSVERVVWIWGAILESAAEINDDGRYDFDPAEAAYFLRADEADVRAIEACLEHSGRLREGRVARWGDRQFKSDDSRDRVRKHRLAKGNGNGGEVSGRKAPERDGNVDVTAKKRYGNAPETDTDTELSNESSAAPSGAPKRDARTILFAEGLTTLARLADRKPASLRPIIGRWMQRTGDDARAVLGEIARCRDSPVADPIASIEARLKPRDPDAKPRRTSNAEQAMSAMASAVARLNGSHERDADAPGERGGERGPGIGNPGPGALAAIPARHGAG